MHLVNEFVHNSYARIMVRMVEESDKAGGLNFDEMIAELDLSPDSTGAIPLTKNPPEFQIVPISKYHDGTRLNEPGSIFAHIHNLNEEQLEKFRKNFFDVFENQQKDRKSTELLSVVCFPNGTSSFQSFSRWVLAVNLDYVKIDLMFLYFCGIFPKPSGRRTTAKSMFSLKKRLKPFGVWL